jgi:hypothetical protein
MTELLLFIRRFFGLDLLNLLGVCFEKKSSQILIFDVQDHRGSDCIELLTGDGPSRKFLLWVRLCNTRDKDVSSISEKWSRATPTSSLIQSRDGSAGGKRVSVEAISAYAVRTTDEITLPNSQACC